MSWWDSYWASNRAELAAGALELAERGWPVLPGTFWEGGRWTGVPAASQSGPAPVLAVGAAGASRDRATVARWWSELPYSVLLATGSAVDVIEVSALVGRRLSARLRDVSGRGPVAVTPTGRWLFAVGAGEALRPELAGRPDVTLHSRGSWVVVPPSAFAQGGVHWRVSPSASDASLPDTYEVQVALLDVLGHRPVLAAAAPGAVMTATGVHSWLPGGVRYN